MWRLRVGYLTAGPGAEGQGASVPSQMLHLPCLPVSMKYEELKRPKHEIFDLGVLTPTKLIWLGDLGTDLKSKFSLKLMLIFVILYFKRMLSIG
jgi:hypothetical protein